MEPWLLLPGQDSTLHVTHDRTHTGSRPKGNLTFILQAQSHPGISGRGLSSSLQLCRLNRVTSLQARSSPTLGWRREPAPGTPAPWGGEDMHSHWLWRGHMPVPGTASQDAPRRVNSVQVPRVARGPGISKRVAGGGCGPGPGGVTSGQLQCDTASRRLGVLLAPLPSAGPASRSGRELPCALVTRALDPSASSHMGPALIGRNGDGTRVSRVVSTSTSAFRSANGPQTRSACKAATRNPGAVQQLQVGRPAPLEAGLPVPRDRPFPG